MPADAEEVQEIGRSGVATIKRWLEATTYLELPFDAYHHAPECTVLHMGGRKKFDLAGHYLVGNKDPVVVEAKRYGSPGGQYKMFGEFLATAYSSVLKDREEFGQVRSRHFIWVTYHPFNLDRWKHLETVEEMQRALTANPQYLGDMTIDTALLHETAKRVTVLVFNPKQEQLSLTRGELQLFRTVLDRKALTV